MIRIPLFFVLALLSTIPPPLTAYELSTHARITYAAYQRSILADQWTAENLGLDTNAIAPVGDRYYDVSGDQVIERRPRDFEAQFMPVPIEQALTLSAWLMRGAIREDDVLALDDPVNAIRVLNHFYDPVNKRPLTKLGISAGAKAPDWARGSTDAFAQPDTPDPNRNNHYAWFDAREAFYRALSGRSGANSTAIYPDGTGGARDPANAAEAEQMLNAYWATAFRALGDVLHLVEDMAQPQHTRNDAHVLAGDRIDRKAYEQFTDQRAKGIPFKCFGGGVEPASPLTYDSYPVVVLNVFGDYFSTEAGAGGNVANGRGLADYSNRNFFSAGTNLGSGKYTLPVENPAAYQRVDTDVTSPCVPRSGQFQRKRLLLGSVTDRLRTEPAYQAVDVPLTSSGLWRHPSHTEPGEVFEEAGFALTEENYIAQADLLIPRAVGYAAGLINYFFRGRIALERDIENVAEYRIGNNSTEALEGNFTLYYDAVDGLRYPIPNATWDLQLDAGTRSDPVSFTVPVDPAPTTANDYMLVFRGDLGNETDSAGAVGAVAGRRVCIPQALGPAYKSTLVVNCDGGLWGWGSNTYGQLYGATGLQSELPVRVTSLGVSLRALVSGGGATATHILAIDTGGTVWAWGTNAHGEVGNGSPQNTAAPSTVLNNALAIDTAANHSIAVKTDGSVWTWGSNIFRQLGYDSNETVVINGQTQEIGSFPQSVPGLAGVTEVAAGIGTSLSLANGTVWQWGQMNQIRIDSPQLVSGLPAGIVSLRAGQAHYLALDGSGRVWAWGLNREGQLGNGTQQSESDTPVLVPGLVDIVSIAAGYNFSVALARDGRVWTWGDDRFGQLGDGSAAPDTCTGIEACGRRTPAPITGLPDVIDISAGAGHVIAMQSDGALWTWGSDELGQVGDNDGLTPLAQPIPRRVELAP